MKCSYLNLLFTFFFLWIFVVYSTIYVWSSFYVNVWGRPVSFSVNALLDSHYEKYVEQKDYKPFLRNRMCSQAHLCPTWHPLLSLLLYCQPCQLLLICEAEEVTLLMYTVLDTFTSSYGHLCWFLNIFFTLSLIF